MSLPAASHAAREGTVHPYEPIDKLVALITRLPGKPENSYGREAALFGVSVAVGLSRPRTGIPFDPDRPINHLFWDHRPEDLRSRLAHLVVHERMKAEFLIKGLIFHLYDHLSKIGGPGAAERDSAINQIMLDNARAELELPQDQRDQQHPDETLDMIIAVAGENIRTAHQRAADALAARNALEQLTTELYPGDYWQDFTDYITSPEGMAHPEHPLNLRTPRNDDEGPEDPQSDAQNSWRPFS